MIHGILLTPRVQQRLGKPWPTVVYAEGGPGMVVAAYGGMGEEFEILSLAARGYAVLIPNTRGRPGYGVKFERAIKDGASFGRLPFEDLMAGVDYLVKRGIADPARLGIWGMSYGGYLATYAVTQTHRFRAAVSYEGGFGLLVDRMMQILPGSGEDKAFVQRGGIRNPFLPETLERLVAESPGLNAHCVSTPILLLMGERSRFKEHSGAVLYSALKRFDVPVDMILYDEGHGFQRPSSQIDYITRIGVWFDYWARGMPYAEPAIGEQFD